MSPVPAASSSPNPAHATRTLRFGADERLAA